jgi:hypothetical protein
MAIHSKLTPVGRFFAAAVVAVLAFACTADAVQTNTTPNVSVIPYNLAAGAATGNLTPPNTSTLVMGDCTTSGFRGVAMTSLVRIPTLFIMWSGINSTGNGSVNSGYSGAFAGGGTQILQIDFSGNVWIEVGTTKDTVRIHNTSGGQRAGSTTWLW